MARPPPPSSVEARRRIPAPLSVRYSCTEAGIGCGTAFTDPLEDAEVSVGRPQPGVRLSIVAEDGTPLPPGEIGEVCLGSPAVMEGYWRNSTANADVFTEDGSVRTGDLGWLDDQGRLRLAGRNQERYVRGGYNVHPMEVEAVLADHPDVVAVALVGRTDPVMGEVGVAVIVPGPEAPTPRPVPTPRLRLGSAGPLQAPRRSGGVDRASAHGGEKVDRRALERLIRRAAELRARYRTGPELAATKLNRDDERSFLRRSCRVRPIPHGVKYSVICGAVSLGVS